MRVMDISAPTPQGPASREQQAFLLAVDFHEAALRSGAPVRDPLGAPVLALVPMLVAYAFASELYLKSLAPSGRGAGVKGHKLNVLFSRLDDRTKEKVSAGYSLKTGRDRATLERDLRELADAFVEWRYVYEVDGRQLHANLLIAFALTIYETICQLRPDWKVSAYQHDRILAGEEQPSITVKNVGGGTYLHVVDGTGTLNLPES